MAKVKPKLVGKPFFCIENPAPPTALVIFGASGDLTKRKIIPALYELKQQDLLHKNFYIIGCARTKFSDEEFRESIRQALPDDQNSSDFLQRCYYVSGQYDKPELYSVISEKIKTLDKKYNINCAHLFYLAVPPTLFETIASQLDRASIAKCYQTSNTYPRFIIEKPFGRDYNSAVELNNTVHRYFTEEQVYRIDHYLGKETVQNILMFRFANTIFEPLWNRNYIDNVQITIAESIGIEHRGGYYDNAGALRDMFQNHMLQILSLIAMEPPSNFDADQIRDEKVKLLRSIRPLTSETIETDIVKGQYASYTKEPDIPEDSTTETFIAAKMLIDNMRWKDVPFYLRTGKCLAEKVTSVAITFKQVPHSMFATAGIDSPEPNILLIRIQPEEGISLFFQAKHPGSKTCMGTIDMEFDYSELFGVTVPEAYSRLLLDAMLGDQTLFTRADDVIEAWKLIQPILEYWQTNKTKPIIYNEGQASFPQADKITEQNGREWFNVFE